MNAALRNGMGLYWYSLLALGSAAAFAWAWRDGLRYSPVGVAACWIGIGIQVVLILPSVKAL